MLDDMVDLALDIKTNHHNYVASLIQYGENKDEIVLLKEMLKYRKEIEISDDLLFQFPATMKIAATKARNLLKTGAKNLFAPDHQFMVDVSIVMISKRIGADRFLSDIEI